ncbi:MAG: hypothetical protein AAF591_17915 [Verrucomicrobiota bacterium]
MVAKLSHSILVVLSVLALGQEINAQTTGDTYVARISDQDKVDSKNTRIAKAIDILKQDRANYHRFKRRDQEDQNDSYLNTLKKRAAATFSMGDATKKAIESGNPLVAVTYQNGSFDVSIVAPASPARKPSLRTGAPQPAVATPTPKQDSDTSTNFLGQYEQVPVENDWHKVTIERDTGGKLLWKNAAGRSWPLELRNRNELWTTKDCPYGEAKLGIKKDAAGKIAGLEFNGGFYRMVAAANSDPKPLEIVFGNNATLSGRIEQLKTYDDAGKAVFSYYLYTDNKIIVKPAIDFDPGDTNQVLDGMEVKTLGGKDADLEQYKGMQVTINGHVSSGTGLNVYGFAMYIDGSKKIKAHHANTIDTVETKIVTPQRGSQIRKDICDAFRVPMKKEVDGQDIVFVIHTLNVMGDWAFINSSLQLANGKEVDWKKAGLIVDPDVDFVENSAIGLLKKNSRGNWSVIAHSFNHTDVVWIDWDKKHGVSKKLFE